MKKKNIKIEEILTILPHKFPFLFVDRVLDWKKNKYIYSIKNVTYNDCFLQGHFFNRLIFPGVLVLESIVQTACILFIKSKKKLKEKGFYYLSKIKQAKFKYSSFPGDCLLINVLYKKNRNNFFFFKGEVKVKKKIICKTQVICKRVFFK